MNWNKSFFLPKKKIMHFHLIQVCIMWMKCMGLHTIVRYLYSSHYYFSFIEFIALYLIMAEEYK